MKLLEVTLYGTTYDLIEDEPLDLAPCCKCEFLAGIPNDPSEEKNPTCRAICTEFEKLGHFEKHQNNINSNKSVKV